jgi:glutaredoxin
VKDFLDKHKVKYTDKNVAEDHDAQHEMIDKSGQMGVPVIDIDGTIVVGFDQEKIKKTMKL